MFPWPDSRFENTRSSCPRQLLSCHVAIVVVVSEPRSIPEAADKVSDARRERCRGLWCGPAAFSLLVVCDTRVPCMACCGLAM